MDTGTMVVISGLTHYQVLVGMKETYDLLLSQGDLDNAQALGALKLITAMDDYLAVKSEPAD